MAEGISRLKDGAGTLADGASRLQDGSASMTEGLKSATDVSGKLASSLDDGASTIDDALTTDADTAATYVADPVEMEKDTYGELDSFGLGFIPLFFTLALWLGALLIFFIFEPFPPREQLGASRYAAIFGRWPLYLVLSTLEALVMLIGGYLSGTPYTDAGMAALVIACIAFSFMCILQFLNLFGIVGKAMAVLLVALQLVCCSGTLPAVLGSDFAEAVGPSLPFYYSIDAIREIMSGGVAAVAFSDMGMLLVFAAGSVVLSLITYPLALRMKRKTDAATLENILGPQATEAAQAQSA